VKRILHSAIDKIYNWNNLSEASRKVMRNKGSGGVDRMSVEKWAQKERQHLSTLRHRLINDTYRSKPVLRCYIDKPGKQKEAAAGNPCHRRPGLPTSRSKCPESGLRRVFP